MHGSSYKGTCIPQINSLNTIFNSHINTKFQGNEEQCFFSVFNNFQSNEEQTLTGDKIYDFFEQMSNFLKTENISNLSELLKNENITSFDDSFIKFEIANEACKLFQKSDKTFIFIELLDFFLKLIHLDNQYITNLLDARFLECIFLIYKDVNTCDCLISSLKCASSIVKTLDEHQDDIDSLFYILTTPKPIENYLVFSEILVLISALLDFKIDFQKLNIISAFIFSKGIVDLIFSYSNEKVSLFSRQKKEYNEKKIACQNYTQCLLKLSYFDEWLQIFIENDLADLFINLLSSKDKYILNDSSISLLPIIHDIQINSKEFVGSIINLLFNNHASISRIGCLALRYLIVGPNQEIFLDEEFFEEKSHKIFDQLMKLSKEKFEKKIQAFDALGHFLTVFVDRLQEIIYENQEILFDLIEEMLDLEENCDSIPIALTLLDHLFRTENEKGESELYSRFIERGGLDQVEEIALNFNDNEKIMEYISDFLAYYRCESDDFTYEEIVVD